MTAITVVIHYTRAGEISFDPWFSRDENPTELEKSYLGCLTKALDETVRYIQDATKDKRAVIYQEISLRAAAVAQEHLEAMTREGIL